MARGICHRNLQELCEAIAEGRAAGRQQRLFGNHYRVAFFGRAFGALDGTEVIYREPASVRLADFSERLQRQYGGKFEVEGGKVPLLPNSRERIDPATRDPDSPAMQIVSVEPHFEPAEARKRRTPYERAFVVQEFKFQTPFTESGKARGDIASQHLLRSFVRTEVPLPATRKRVRIVERRDVVLTPIETGCEMIEEKAATLRRELGLAGDGELDVGDAAERAASTDLGALAASVLAGAAAVATQAPGDGEIAAPLQADVAAQARGAAGAAEDDAASDASRVDLKSLQMLLQGALLLQVNAGPLEVFRTFLSPEVVGSHNAGLVKRLRCAMLHFLQLLSRAVALNNRLVGAEQEQLQTALDEGLASLTEKIKTFL